MCAFYKLENSNLIPIIYKFIEKSVFTQYPVNIDEILNIKHYYHIPFYVIQTRTSLYYYIDSIEHLNDIVNSMKRNIINEDIIENEKIIKKIDFELSNYKFHHPNFLHDDDYLLIEKRLYHAHENLRTSKNMQISPIFIEDELPDTLHNFFMV